MAGQFTSVEGDLESIYVTDYNLIDQNAGTPSLWLWGNNSNGQLGDNTQVAKLIPVQTAAAGTNWKLTDGTHGTLNSAAIKNDGTLWLSGYNVYGSLGDNTQVDKSSPVQTIAGGTNWKQASGGGYSQAAIKTDGTLWTWGHNGFGNLGKNDTTHRSSPVQTVAGGTNWKQVAVTAAHMAAIKTDGTLWLWGYNAYGQHGANNLTMRSSPVQTVSGGSNWKSVVAAANNTAAIKTDGTLWTWGHGGNGILGNNAITHKSSPIQTVAGGTNWKQVASGGIHLAAIKTDGTLWAWGYNFNGQLGDNTSVAKSSPVMVNVTTSSWKHVGAGAFHTVAIQF